MGFRNRPKPGGGQPWVVVNPADGSSTTTINAGNSGFGSTAPATVVLSSLIEPGDQLLLVVCCLNADTRLITPAGWDPIVPQGAGAMLFAYTRTADNTDAGANVSVGMTSSVGDWLIYNRVYRADNGVSVAAAALGFGPSSTSHKTPALAFDGGAMTCQVWGVEHSFGAAKPLIIPTTLADPINTGGSPTVVLCGHGNVAFSGGSPGMTATSPAEDGDSSLAVALQAN